MRPDRLSLLFSATLPRRLQETARAWLRDPAEVRVGVLHISRGPGADQCDCGQQVRISDVEAAADEHAGTRGPVTYDVHVCAAHKRPRLLLSYLTRYALSSRLSHKLSRSIYNIDMCIGV